MASRSGNRRILIAVTSHSGPLGRRPTGAWLGEITGFWDEIGREGFDFEFASPAGGDPPIDPVSALLPGASKLAFAKSARAEMTRSIRSNDIDPSRYDAIFFAGGHGALWDFPADPGLILASEAIWRAGGILAAVCHGPAALLQLKDEEGRLLLQGRRATAYSNLEERLGRMESKVPFMLETSMRELGARYERAALPFAKHVVTDGRLVTGQNPMSARGVGREVAALLRVDARARKSGGDGAGRRAQPAIERR